ncbi:MAG: oligopeptide/dipeptide ABC transporter ATP-binding protein [Pseudomonadota bacterium]|nr:oligopeptide/dipeptide ABC transporter ATP-binding protein [Pseudomonadota bacterium]
MNDAVQTVDVGGASAGGDTPMLECRGVGRNFIVGKGIFTEKKNLRAVQDVNLKVNRGEVLAVVGESGCGKTTLAKMMLGLLKPSSGEIFIEGQPISNVSIRQIARKVQPVFQDPYSSLNPRKTLEAIMSLPLKVHSIGTPEERRQRVEEIMEMVELPKRLIHSYPNQLSGGQRQRVAVARALIMKPEVILCDEPTSALDVSVQAHILNLLQDLRDEMNLTYVFISHDLAVVEHLADNVAVMYLGRLIEYGDKDSIFNDPQHPYSQALLDSVLTPDPSKGIPEIALGRGFPNPLDPPSGCSFHPRCSKILDNCSEANPVMYNVPGGRRVECHLFN